MLKVGTVSAGAVSAVDAVGLDGADVALVEVVVLGTVCVGAEVGPVGRGPTETLAAFRPGITTKKTTRRNTARDVINGSLQT